MSDESWGDEGSQSSRRQRSPDMWGQPHPIEQEEQKSSYQQQFPPPGEPQRNSSKVIIAVVVAAALVVIAALEFFFYGQDDDKSADVAVSQETSTEDSVAEETASGTTTTSSTQTAAENENDLPPIDESDPNFKRCSLKTLQRNPALGGVDTIVKCEGNWMIAGASGTGDPGLYYWTGEEWLLYREDGRTSTDFSCYDEDKLDRAGIAQSVKDKLLLCGQAQDDASGSDAGGANALPTVSVTTAAGEVYSSSPACDGSYILILDSPTVYDQSDLNSVVGRSLSAYPNSKFTTPGRCASLRASVNGGDIYPVYFDGFGKNTDRLCSAKAQWGGNARQLNTSGDMSDPC